ncbi:MAG: hypothetical protein GEV08_12200 [Acidimicrobiia bacterium]|nr:hypothetical protein [Acidimicrobiia bacterium]
MSDRPLRVDEFLERALYAPEDGFYASGRGRAGRRGDFLTSPEVGPLFGAVLARALEAWWRELGRPDPFTVVEAGAGVGTLARSVLAASPGVPLRYVAVERAAPLREQHPEGVKSLEDLPEGPVLGVVVANELLDNLPFRLLDPEGEVHVDEQGGEVLLASELALPRHGRVPAQEEAGRWLRRALGCLERGRVLLFDYGSTTAELEHRDWRSWVRTYQGHQRGGHPFAEPGSQDVTCEVAWDQLSAVATPARRRTQRAFLEAWGIDGLVAEGRRDWQARAHLGDLAALRARSRVREAEALLDPTGLGAFDAVEWEV